jgi:hypothetical protein
MSETDQDWVPLEGRDLLVAVRAILVENPERHDQQVWVGNFYLTPDELADGTELMLPADLIRQYAMRPLTTQPEEPGAQWPVCGSLGCVAGWGAVLSAPHGSFIKGPRIVLPSGEKMLIHYWAAEKMGLSNDQAAYLFSAGRGSRERLIRILDALIENPNANVELVL